MRVNIFVYSREELICMPTIIFIEASGRRHEVQQKIGETVMRAATDHEVPGIVAQCGGSCSCATCHGFVDDAWLGRLPPAQPDESSLIEGLLDAQVNSRLTCQITITPELDGLVINIPESQA
jgi:2Fe-2S ferredoxin